MPGLPECSPPKGLSSWDALSSRYQTPLMYPRVRQFQCPAVKCIIFEQSFCNGIGAHCVSEGSDLAVLWAF